MNVYHYKDDTREYIDWSVARESPLEVGKYLCPNNATFTEVIDRPVNKAAIFTPDNDNVTIGVWNLIDDFRGTSHYNKSDGVETVITELGVVVPETSVTVAPTEGLYKPQWNGAEWVETALIFKGSLVVTKADVDDITKFLIRDLDEEKVKTEYLESVYNGEDAPTSWITFLAARNALIIEGNVFIAENSLV